MPQTEKVQILQLTEFDPQRLVSKLVHDSPNMRVAIFCLEPGQEVAPHTSSSEVAFFIVQGQGKVLVGENQTLVARGSLVFCPPHIPHGLSASKRLVALAVIAPRA